MTNKLVVILKSLKVPKIKKILQHEMKFLLPLQLPPEPLTRGTTAPDPLLCPLSSTEFVEPPDEQNSWVRHCLHSICNFLHSCLGYIVPYVTVKIVLHDSDRYVHHTCNIAVKTTLMCRECCKWQTAYCNNKYYILSRNFFGFRSFVRKNRLIFLKQRQSIESISFKTLFYQLVIHGFNAVFHYLQYLHIKYVKGTFK